MAHGYQKIHFRCGVGAAGIRSRRQMAGPPPPGRGWNLNISLAADGQATDRRDPSSSASLGDSWAGGRYLSVPACGPWGGRAGGSSSRTRCRRTLLAGPASGASLRWRGDGSGGGGGGGGGRAVAGLAWRWGGRRARGKREENIISLSNMSSCEAPFRPWWQLSAFISALLTGQALSGLQGCINYSELKTAPRDGRRPPGCTSGCAAPSICRLGPAITQLCQAAHPANESDTSVTETRLMENRKWAGPEPAVTRPRSWETHKEWVQPWGGPASGPLSCLPGWLWGRGPQQKGGDTCKHQAAAAPKARALAGHRQGRESPSPTFSPKILPRPCTQRPGFVFPSDPKSHTVFIRKGCRECLFVCTPFRSEEKACFPRAGSSKDISLAGRVTVTCNSNSTQ